MGYDYDCPKCGGPAYYYGGCRSCDMGVNPNVKCCGSNCDICVRVGRGYGGFCPKCLTNIICDSHQECKYCQNDWIKCPECYDNFIPRGRIKCEKCYENDL